MGQFLEVSGRFPLIHLISIQLHHVRPPGLAAIPWAHRPAAACAGLVLLIRGWMIFGERNTSGDKTAITYTTWWFIPLSKWVITLVINGISGVSPLITRVITHLLSGMNHQVSLYLIDDLNCCSDVDMINLCHEIDRKPWCRRSTRFNQFQERKKAGSMMVPSKRMTLIYCHTLQNW